jgi:hypothetical protein
VKCGQDARDPQARCLRSKLRTKSALFHQGFNLRIAAAEVAIAFRRIDRVAD